MTLDLLKDALKEAEQEYARWEKVVTGLRAVEKALNDPVDGLSNDEPIELIPEPVHNRTAPRNGTIMATILHVLRDGQEMGLRDLKEEVEFQLGHETRISGVLSTETNKPQGQRRVERTGPGMYRLAG